jgi:hypothetical protein
LIRPAESIDENMDADEKYPNRQDSEAPRQIIAPDQEDQGETVPENGNPARHEVGEGLVRDVDETARHIDAATGELRAKFDALLNALSSSEVAV